MMDRRRERLLSLSETYKAQIYQEPLAFFTSRLTQVDWASPEQDSHDQLLEMMVAPDIAEALGNFDVEELLRAANTPNGFLEAKKSALLERVDIFRITQYALFVKDLRWMRLQQAKTSW